jgi:CrcB protein
MSPANHPRKIQERVPKEGERRVSFGKKDRNGMTKYWMVALGGAVGSVLRFWVGGNVADRLGTRFPYGTFAVNITGSFLIGLVLTLVSERVNVNPSWRYLIGVGFIGGYTTFSAFEYETFQSMQGGKMLIASLNVILSVAIGLICVWLGVAAARALD